MINATVKHPTIEFLDEDARTRFVFQSRPIPSSLADQQSQQESLNKPLVFIAVIFSSVLLIFSILYLQTETFKSLLFWVSISFFIGPFAPSNVTGGDISVGQGPIVETHDEEPEISTEKRVPKRRSKAIRSEETVIGPIQGEEKTNGLSIKDKRDEVSGNVTNGFIANEGDTEWSEEDLHILKKQMVKNPVGKSRSWEVIAVKDHRSNRSNKVSLCDRSLLQGPVE
ncbi:hypothetical protein JCGZ_11845 [Jatropha curcas]|uniref:Myb-like domain-containing protein n=1 Tax=Jatropha curcas TaxID=180498 RepID=A0A067LC08_JATCU|nr:hypothetical protein JCGZ_11845 [Jatropha curcas]